MSEALPNSAWDFNHPPAKLQVPEYSQIFQSSVNPQVNGHKESMPQLNGGPPWSNGGGVGGDTFLLSDKPFMPLICNNLQSKDTETLPQVIERVSTNHVAPDLLHLFKKSADFARLCDFRISQVRSEGAALVHLLQLCEEQHKYLSRMKQQAYSDLSQLRSNLYSSGYGELLATPELHPLQYRSTRSPPPCTDKFLNGWYKNSVFADTMQEDSDDLHQCSAEPEYGESESEGAQSEPESDLDSM
jgi:hypothetical protein